MGRPEPPTRGTAANLLRDQVLDRVTADALAAILRLHELTDAQEILAAERKRREKAHKEAGEKREEILGILERMARSYETSWPPQCGRRMKSRRRIGEAPGACPECSGGAR